MDTFANYILEEKDLSAKIEITYYLAKKEKIFFDKSVIFKTELARLFLENNKLGLDENLVLTACLLSNCKKMQSYTTKEEVQQYAKNGAEYLLGLGFDKRFCKICEELNRYSKSNPRERESDVLELVDQFGGLLLDRPERIGFKADEALILLKYRNLKDIYNKYLEVFEDFVTLLEDVRIEGNTQIKAIEKLVQMHNSTEDIKEFAKKVFNEYEPEVDKAISNKYKNIEEEMFKEQDKVSKRSLFTEETTKMILENIEKRKKSTEAI